jgi:hypothetical protein
MYSIVLNKMFSEKKKIFETFFCSEVSVFTAVTVCLIRLGLWLEGFYIKTAISELINSLQFWIMTFPAFVCNVRERFNFKWTNQNKSSIKVVCLKHQKTENSGQENNRSMLHNSMQYSFLLVRWSAKFLKNAFANF